MKNANHHAKTALIHQQNAHHVLKDSFMMETTNASNANHHALHALEHQHNALDVLMVTILMKQLKHARNVLEIATNVQELLNHHALNVLKVITCHTTQAKDVLDATKHARLAMEVNSTIAILVSMDFTNHQMMLVWLALKVATAALD